MHSLTAARKGASHLIAGRRRAACLAVLIALAVLAAEAPRIHAHADEGRGWYDKECPLSRLAAGLPGATPLESDPQASRLPEEDRQGVAGCTAPRHLAPLDCEARAPPRAS